MKSLSMDAPAKINLFLDMESKRADGYHNIISVMQSISLCDTVTVEYTQSNKKEIEITCNAPEIPLGEKNIAYKAATRLIDSGIVRIHIKKRIPAAAGLAGGSTDAAAVILLLNSLIENKKSESELLEIGTKIGADVPFCMLGGTKLTRGIGDVMTDFTSMPDCYIVVAKKGEGISTPEAYYALDKMYSDFNDYAPKTSLLERLEAQDMSGMFNIFESVVIPQRPAVQELKDCMISHGASFCMMSGSGPSVFGIFDSESKASAAREHLIMSGADACVCRPQ